MYQPINLLRYWAVLGLTLLLIGCTTTMSLEQTAEIVTTRPVLEATVEVTAEATTTLPPISPTLTTTPELPTAVPPISTLETAQFSPRFDHFLAYIDFDSGSTSLVGLIQQANNWQLMSTAYPTDTDSVNSDYVLATDRLLTWSSGGSAGPGNLAAGSLRIIDLTTQTQEIVVPNSVIAAGWAANGLDFAYILGTPETYELRWRTANGEDTLLAVDVPHSLRVSPDGRFVAFTRESHYDVTAVPGLYIVEIATGIETQLSPLDRAGYGGMGLFWKPHWSPDSSQLILYTAADDDRAPEPHEAGYVWAAADGSFSHFLPQSAFLAQFDEPLNDPDAFRCLDTPVLFAAYTLIMGVGECPPMVGDPLISQPAVFALDAQTGTVQLQKVLSNVASAQLLSWDTPGEAVLLQEGELIISHPIE